VQNPVFWLVAPCRLANSYRRFGRDCCLIIQGLRLSTIRHSVTFQDNCTVVTTVVKSLNLSSIILFEPLQSNWLILFYLMKICWHFSFASSASCKSSVLTCKVRLKHARTLVSSTTLKYSLRTAKWTVSNQIFGCYLIIYDTIYLWFIVLSSLVLSGCVNSVCLILNKFSLIGFIINE